MWEEKSIHVHIYCTQEQKWVGSFCVIIKKSACTKTKHVYLHFQQLFVHELVLIHHIYVYMYMWNQNQKTPHTLHVQYCTCNIHTYMYMYSVYVYVVIHSMYSTLSHLFSSSYIG